MNPTSKPEQTAGLIGGWMPAGWWGDDVQPAAQRPQLRRMRSKAKSWNGLKKRDARLKTFRRRYQQTVAIVAADHKADRTTLLPFSVEQERRLDGELHFLTLCQVLFRERACKEVLSESLHGEDLIQRLIYAWAEGPLQTGHLRSAMKDTSLDLDEGDDDDDD